MHIAIDEPEGYQATEGEKPVYNDGLLNKFIIYNFFNKYIEIKVFLKYLLFINVYYYYLWLFMNQLDSKTIDGNAIKIEYSKLYLMILILTKL